MMPAPGKPQRPSPRTFAANGQENPGNGFDKRLMWQMDFIYPRQYQTPNELQHEIEEYFAFSDAEPIWKPQMNIKTGMVYWIPKPRPYSTTRMCCYLGIAPETWAKYKTDETLGPVTKWAEARIYEHRFEGGVADVMNPMLIARRLGLGDKMETRNDTTTIDVTPQTDPAMIADKTHPDDPDPTGIDSGVWPRPLYSQHQIDAGVPFHPPTPKDDDE